MTAPTPHAEAVDKAYDALHDSWSEHVQASEGAVLPRDAEAAIRAYLAEMEARGWKLVPRLPTEAMVEAWTKAVTKNGANLDEMQIEIGTGQGDMATCPRWKNLAIIMHLWERHAAMYDAAPTPAGE